MGKKYTAHQLNQLKLKELRKYAQSYGLKTSGKPKWVIIDELTDHKYKWVDASKKRKNINEGEAKKIFKDFLEIEDHEIEGWC